MNRQDVEAIIHRQASAWENGAVETIVSDFAEDSVFIAAGQKFQGKKAIKAVAEAYFQQFTATKIDIKRIIIEDDSAAVEWDWSDINRSSNLSSFAEDAIIFQLKNDKIVYWREYIEKK
ncbi:MAG: nuclear transport factor 2 family protein, partial [Xenococcaceae cyanobacterium MO_188.B19]|nr:nuclear transport factor 2 family protein [Xenococcaceae cyanobacterium MO_188.B19]